MLKVFVEDCWNILEHYLIPSSLIRIQRELILAKQQEIEMMRAKNCGRKPLVRDGLRPESEGAYTKKAKRLIRAKIHHKYFVRNSSVFDENFLPFLFLL